MNKVFFFGIRLFYFILKSFRQLVFISSDVGQMKTIIYVFQLDCKQEKCATDSKLQDSVATGHEP